MDKAGVIYKIDCKDCRDDYVGETERNLRHRFKEHRRDSSPVGAHLLNKHHHMDRDCVKILDQEHRWFERGVKEAIHIRAHQPTLNRDRGRHILPAVYNSLVRSQGREFAHDLVH